MPNLGGITQSPIDVSDRALRAWNLIQRDPSSVTLLRQGAKLDPQTMRVELSSGGRTNDMPVGLIGTQIVVLFGIKDHPTLPDTDIKRLDRAVIDNKEYTIDVLIDAPGEVQAFGSVKS